MKTGMLTLALATAALGLSTATASAQGLPSVPGLPPVAGTECGAGLVVINLGGTTVCGAPTTPPAGTTAACADGAAAVEVAGQGLLCLLPGQGATPCPSTAVAVQPTGGGGVICVLATNITPPGAGDRCAGGLVPVQVLGGALGCLVATAVGGPGGAGGSGTPGAPGAPGSTGSTTSTTTGSAGRGSTGSAGSASDRRVLKPTLKLTQRVRRTTRGLVRSSTRKVVITTIGRRNGRVVRFTKSISLKRTSPLTAARPYSARVRITVKTKGALRIRLTSRGAGGVKTATYKRTVRR